MVYAIRVFANVCTLYHKTSDCMDDVNLQRVALPTVARAITQAASKLAEQDDEEETEDLTMHLSYSLRKLHPVTIDLSSIYLS